MQLNRTFSGAILRNFIYRKISHLGFLEDSNPPRGAAWVEKVSIAPQATPQGGLRPLAISRQSVKIVTNKGKNMSAKDKRPTLTVKGDMFTPEFRAKLNKAARKMGVTQAQFVAEALEQAATRVLTGKAEDPAPEAPTPALVERMEATDAKLEALAAQVQALTDAQRKTFWQRVFGAKA